jgi:hypothetical protein
MFFALGRNHDDFKKSSLETTMETRMQVKYKLVSKCGISWS